MIDDKQDRLDALVEKSWMYRALKMETEIQDLREEIAAFRNAQRRANEMIFDKLHDIAVAIDVQRRLRPGDDDLREIQLAYEHGRITYEEMRRLSDDYRARQHLARSSVSFANLNIS